MLIIFACVGISVYRAVTDSDTTVLEIDISFMLYVVVIPVPHCNSVNITQKGKYLTPIPIWQQHFTKLLQCNWPCGINQGRKVWLMRPPSLLAKRNLTK